MYMYVSNKIDIHNSTQLIYILKCTDTEMHTFIYHKKKIRILLVLVFSVHGESFKDRFILD